MAQKDICESKPNYLWTSILTIIGVVLFLYFVLSCKGRRIH